MDGRKVGQNNGTLNHSKKDSEDANSYTFLIMNYIILEQIDRNPYELVQNLKDEMWNGNRKKK